MGFAVKLPRAMAVVRGPKACKHQTTMSRLTRVHASVIQSLFTALFPQAAELRWKTIHWLCITHILSGLCSLRLSWRDSRVQNWRKGEERGGKKNSWTQWNAALLHKDEPLRSSGVFRCQENKKKRSKFTVKIISKTWCIGLLQGEKYHL